MRLDSAGNMGLGVTPSAWGGSYTKALQLKSGGGIVNNVDNDIHMFLNCYYNGTNWIYGASNPSSRYEQYNGGHYWFNAASGTAGNTISFNQAMTLDASGNLGVGTTSPSVRLHAEVTDSTNSGAAVAIFRQNGAGNNGIVVDAASTPSNYVADFRIANSSVARIDSGGDLLVGTTSARGSGIHIGKQYGGVDLSGGGGSWANWGGAYGIFPYAGVGLGIATAASIGFVNSTGAQIASIDGTTGVYTPLSDAGKKKDFEDSNVGLAEVLQLKPKLFRMLDDANDAPKQLGFIAQEVKLFVPQAYVENKIAEDQTFIGLQDRPIIAALVKSIQEQQTLITALTARITALESSTLQ